MSRFCYMVGWFVVGCLLSYALTGCQTARPVTIQLDLTYQHHDGAVSLKVIK